MAGENTLIVTTRSGVRPLGVRGEPLHNAASQLRRVIQRRLGRPAADLLADPQLHEDGHSIDWYAEGTGEVRRVVDLPAAQRIAALAKVDMGLADIARLGEALAKAGHGEDSGVVGRSLQLAARRPAESFVFLLGDKPVVVCWGYEKEDAAALLPPNLPKAPVPQPSPVLAAPALAAPAVLPITSAAAPVASIPWFRSMLLALPLLALLLGAAWLMRDHLAADPALSMTTREGPPAPSAPPAPPDPLPVLRASLSDEGARGKALKIEMAAIENELRKRVSDCKPEPPPPKPEPPKEAPKPPQVAKAVPPPQPAPRPVPPQQPWDGRLRLPRGPTNDYSFLAGCWRSDPFRHELSQMRPGVSSYCFDRSGYGQLEWRRGGTACRTSARAQYDGATLRLRDNDTTCNDGSHWYADQLVCQRGADDIAQCSGNSRGAFGPTSWSVNMHKIR